MKKRPPTGDGRRPVLPRYKGLEALGQRGAVGPRFADEIGGEAETSGIDIGELANIIFFAGQVLAVDGELDVVGVEFNREARVQQAIARGPGKGVR